jgi:hypothetical protein
VEHKDQKIGKYEDESEQVIGALTGLGPGLLESAYDAVSAGLLVNFNVTSLRQGRRRLSLLPSPPS